jgi:hypothetical protein
MIVVGALLALATPAIAQPQQPTAAQIEEAKKHFAKGKELYDKGDKAGAVEEFKEAYKLSKNPTLLYNVGFVYDELKDKPLAVHYYKKFLEDAPTNEKTADNKKLATERVKALEKEIEDENKVPDQPPDQPDQPPDQPDKPAEVFTHSIIEEAPPGKPLDIVAVIPKDSGLKLALFYRRAGEDEFKTTRMKQRYDEMVARIPATEMQGSTMQYYIEVRDPAGKMIAASGRASSPNIVYLDENAKPHFYDDDVDEPPNGDEPPVTPIDTGGSRTMLYAKWGATGGAGLFLTLSVVFYFVASSASADLETEAFNSTHPTPMPDRCGNGTSPPCTQFADFQKGLQSSGQSAETWTNVSLVLGVASAAAAGALWYWDLKKSKKKTVQPGPAESPDDGTEGEDEEARIRLFTAPMVGPSFLGVAAVIEF